MQLLAKVGDLHNAFVRVIHTFVIVTANPMKNPYKHSRLTKSLSACKKPYKSDKT